MAFLDIPEYEKNHENLLRKMIRVTKGMMQGKTNNTGTLTLTPSSTTTVLTFATGQIGQDTCIFLIPKTSTAAGALSSLYISSRNVSTNTLTLTHASTAATDKIYGYSLIG
jgi:hypothetical protein